MTCVVVIFRDFIEKHYVEMKKHNPKFPILVRECSEIQPKVYARFGKNCVTFVPQVCMFVFAWMSDCNI